MARMNLHTLGREKKRKKKVNRKTMNARKGIIMLKSGDGFCASFTVDTDTYTFVDGPTFLSAKRFYNLLILFDVEKNEKKNTTNSVKRIANLFPIFFPLFRTVQL